MSPSIDFHPTEVQLEGVRFESLFKPEFVGLLNQEFEGLKFDHLCLTINSDDDDEKKERITFGYMTKAHEKNSLVTVSTTEHETLNKLIDIMQTFYSDD